MFCTGLTRIPAVFFSRATVSCEQPFTGPGTYSFEVFMKDKKAKTAVGFLSERKTTEYMRDTPIGEPFLSMGGAGWIHPHETPASKKYKEGDRVKVEVNFDAEVVKFYVNSDYAGEAAWTNDKAFPAISSDGGNVEMEVTFCN